MKKLLSLEVISNLKRNRVKQRSHSHLIVRFLLSMASNRTAASFSLETGRPGVYVDLIPVCKVLVHSFSYKNA